MFAMQVDSYQMVSFVGELCGAHPALFRAVDWRVAGERNWLRLPSLLTTLMLGGFLTAMIRAYALGLEINCGCFGPGERVGVRSFVRDGSFFALSLAVTIGAFIMARKKSAPESSVASNAPLEQAR